MFEGLLFRLGEYSLASRVPQGSVLGSILFFYVNDLPDSVLSELYTYVC